jgi:hypothetical protein
MATKADGGQHSSSLRTGLLLNIMVGDARADPTRD